MNRRLTLGLALLALLTLGIPVEAQDGRRGGRGFSRGRSASRGGHSRAARARAARARSAARSRARSSRSAARNRARSSRSAARSRARTSRSTARSRARSFRSSARRRARTGVTNRSSAARRERLERHHAGFQRPSTRSRTRTRVGTGTRRSGSVHDRRHRTNHRSAHRSRIDRARGRAVRSGHGSGRRHHPAAHDRRGFRRSSVRDRHRALHRRRHHRAHHTVDRHRGFRGRAFHRGIRYHRHGHHGHHRAHRYYHRNKFYLSFHFGSGSYLGFRYYSPYYHHVSHRHYAFFYPEPVTYCYVPYGFYTSSAAVYVVDDEPDYETVEYTPQDALDADTGQKVDPEPVAPSPTAERYLREASEAFAEADYETAAEKFRLAAVAAPSEAGPLFAFAQSLIALGKDEYAARVLRRAVALNPAVLEESADIVGVFKDREEFDRVLQALEQRAAAAPPAGDARFLLAAQRFFSGDPRAKELIAPLREALPEDEAVAALAKACEERFEAADDLPPVK